VNLARLLQPAIVRLNVKLLGGAKEGSRNDGRIRAASNEKFPLVKWRRVEYCG
jgi:hypothetical protein